MPRRISTRCVAVWMVFVRADTRIAGMGMEPSCKPLLWHWVRIILIVGCVALWIGLTQFGCGSSRSDAPPAKVEETPAKSAPAADTRPVIVAFGDSLTAGFGAES